jgi:hypothetical protein
MRKLSKSIRALMWAAVTLSVTSIGTHAQQAGTVGAVNTAATGGSGRGLSLGASVFQNERISTNSTGTLHLMFNDRSTLNVGRNSTIVIDRFVYDPGRGSGEMAVSLAKGAARLVGGQVSHDNQATVKTPVATVGVRGGTATIGHNGDSTFVMVHFGSAIVSTASSTVSVRTGMQVVVNGDGTTNQITAIDQNALNGVNQSLESSGQQNAGTSTPPTDQQAASNSIGLGRPAVDTPNIDLPNTGDLINKGYADTARQVLSIPD